MYFLNINKPKGITSFDVIRKLRKILNVKQIGHSGTLDPLATGVMQVAVGSATKLLDYLESDKKYVATLKFGYVTESFDSEFDEIFVSKPDFTKEDLITVLESFVGITKQVPPKYSAIKLQGKKACELARKNLDIKIKERDIEIYSIKLLEFNSYDDIKIEVFSKKGTYIRSLVNDIGTKLGCGAYLTSLERTQAGNFYIENSSTFENLIPINPLKVLSLEKYELNNDEINYIKNGNFIKNNSNLKQNSNILLTKNNKLVSIAILDDNLIKPKKLFKENLL